MSVSYEVRDGYLYVKATGEFSVPIARGILSECVEKAHSHALKQILCDITLVTGFTGPQMLSIVRFNTGELVAQLIPRDFRVAVLETPQQIIESQSKFGENVMVNRGVKIRVVTSLDEALKWLGVTSADKPAAAWQGLNVESQG